MPHREWRHLCPILGQELSSGSFHKISPYCWRCRKPYDYVGWGLSSIEKRAASKPALAGRAALALGNCNLADAVEDRDRAAIQRARDFFEEVLRVAPGGDEARDARDGLARVAALEAGRYDELFPPPPPPPPPKRFYLGALGQRKLTLEITDDGSLQILPMEGDQGDVITIKGKDAQALLSRLVCLLEEVPQERELAEGEVDLLPPWFGGSRTDVIDRLRRVAEALRSHNSGD